MKLGERISTWRQAQGWTQEKLAKRLKLKPASVAQWEIGDTEPTTGNAQRMAKLFGITMDDLFYGPVPHVENLRKPKRRAS